MCTNFLLTAPVIPAGTSSILYASARCMEFAEVMGFNIYLVPQSQKFPLVPRAISNSADWTSTYGFVGIANTGIGFAADPVFMDGLNEAGLSCACLWLPGTAYAASSSQPSQVYFSDFVTWVLGNFDTVSAVVAGLPNISVVGPAVGATGYLPLHFIATDSTGASVVIEFLDQELKVHQLSAGDYGVLTNAPNYGWQLANLKNYRHLTVIGEATSTSGDGPPVGAGLVGMPGDPMSASRFVRTWTLCHGLMNNLPADGSDWIPAPYSATNAGYADTEQTIVNVAMQMVWALQFTPYGTAQITPKAPAVGDWTQWAVVRNHTNTVFYYCSAFNQTIQAIDLTTVDFSSSGKHFPYFAAINLLPPPNSPAWYQSVSFPNNGC